MTSSMTQAPNNIFRFQRARTFAEDGQLEISDVRREVQPAHEPFFRGWDPAMAADTRREMKYEFGSDIAEPGIAQRWEEFERSYLATPRLYEFWHVVIPDAIVEPTRLAVISGNAVVRETLRLLKDAKAIFPDVSEQQLAKARRDPNVTFESDVRLGHDQYVEEAVLLGSGLYSNYFNWVLRYGSRIQIAKAFDRQIKILVPDRNIRYVEETLSCQGLDSDRLVSVGDNVKVGRLHVIAPTAIGRYDLSPVIRFNITRALGRLRLENNLSSRLFIPRNDVKIRNLVNQSELLDALSVFGFTPFDNSAHTVAEQIAAFASCDIVVCPHGAGLSNIVYCRPGTFVVELIPEGYDQGVTSYRSLSDLFGLRYVPIFCREYSMDAKGNRCDSDIAADVGYIVGVVGRLVAQLDAVAETDRRSSAPPPGGTGQDPRLSLTAASTAQPLSGHALVDSDVVDVSRTDVPNKSRGAAPLMPREIVAFLEEKLRACRCYLEYGAGGSTRLAASLGVPYVFSVESDAAWAEAVRREVSNDRRGKFVKVRTVDIGATGKFGYPVGQGSVEAWPEYPIAIWRDIEKENVTPDVVLIDGRFRVACLLVSLLKCKPGTLVLFDDYVGREKRYGWVESLIKPVDIKDRMAVFVVPERLEYVPIALGLAKAVVSPG
jgi:hypothetical protein